MVNSTILVAQQGNASFIKVVGKGSYQNAGLVKSYFERVAHQGVASFTIDLQECAHMDSTFMGVLASLARQQRERQAPVPRIVHLNPRTSELLTNLGLDRILDLESTPASSTAPLIPLSQDRPPSKAETAQTMLEAHRNLIASHQENAAKFQDVIQFLESKLGQRPD